MKASHRVHVVGTTLIAASLVVWYATGSEGYTRWPNERLAHADAPPTAGESELLAEAGFTDAHTASARPDIQSRFALGLVPGGTDPRHLLSVASVAACAVLASAIAMVLRFRNGPHTSTNLQPINEGDRR